MEQIRLTKDIRQGCYSLSQDKRENSVGGLMIGAGSLFSYHPEKIQKSGYLYPPHYACGTHIIMAKDIDWSMFIEASKYDEFIDTVKLEFDKKHD